MKVTTIGTGYVGLVTGACLAEMGNHVVCLDVNAEKIAVLRAGGIPIHEPGLQEIVHRNAEAGRLEFTTDPAHAVAHGTMLFIAVGTPPDEDGSADLQYVLAAARSVGRLMTDYKVVVDKSTVPVGTADKVRAAIAEELAARSVKVDYAVVSNPEFLKEGTAVEDFLKPDRVVIGTDDPKVEEVMRKLYEPFVRTGKPILVMDPASAELSKYAANAMLAARISFMNEIANYCDRVGADVRHVRMGMGTDSRIGSSFLFPGVGYGGSCFPKDVKALIRMGQDAGVSLNVVEATERTNEAQKAVLVPRVAAHLGGLKGKRIAIWGLAFKPRTDDMREAPAIAVIDALLKEGAEVTAYDPKAETSAREVFGDRVTFCGRAYEAVAGADALVVVTEWNEFREPDFAKIRTLMRKPAIFDGRNIYDPRLLRELGFHYEGIGRR